MKEFNSIGKPAKRLATRKLKGMSKAKKPTLPRRPQQQQQTMSWQLLIDRERMLI
jgi:hypothetical protein